MSGLNSDKIQRIEVERWAAEVRLVNGRVELRPAMGRGVTWEDAFRWRVYETLAASRDRLRLCRRQACGRPFLAQRGQFYCRRSCAPSDLDRKRAYWQRWKAEINLRRRRAYDVMMKAKTGGKVRARARRASSLGTNRSAVWARAVAAGE